MGGAVGHLYHLWENPELTFGEIKDIIRAGAEGKLERVSEKLDGMNVVFTWDNASNDLRVARSGGDIKRGGMDAETLAKKFFGRGNVEAAFNSAFQVLRDAISSLADKVRTDVFGPRANRWYSTEIVYAENPNVISYDSNSVVFHGWPVFDVDEAGAVSRSDDDRGVAILTQHVEQMQRAVTARNWRVRGPTVVRMQKLSDGSIARSALREIELAQQRANVDDGDTVQTYLTNLVADEVSRLKLSAKASAAVVARCVGTEDAPTLIGIKKLVPADVYPQVNDFVKQSPKLLKASIAPVEAAIQRFAVQILRSVHSTLVGNPGEEATRIRGEIASAVKAIEASSEPAALDMLRRHLGKLGDLDDVVAMEGIVFLYKGNAYKFTGSFAAANQILGMFRYGRKGTGQEEGYLRQAVERLVLLG